MTQNIDTRDINRSSFRLREVEGQLHCLKQTRAVHRGSRSFMALSPLMYYEVTDTSIPFVYLI